MNKEITISARKYEDHDDCLSAAAEDYAAEHDLQGWDLSPRWADNQREAIVLSVPDWAGTGVGKHGTDYRVMSYKTGNRLKGAPSDKLVEESFADQERRGTGAVYAYQDRDGVWQYVKPSDEDRIRRQGYDVITVWVE